ncbi:MAG: 30S ribosomal protein S8 [Candidatus Aenigmatarchaeota archaeon]
MSQNLLGDALVKIKNAEFAGDKDCTILASDLIKGVLSVMKKNGYLEDFERNENKFKVTLRQKINGCGVIMPHYSITKDDFEKWEKRFLPARGFGILIMTTPQGIIDHNTAKEKDIGGKLMAFVY